MSNYHEFEVDKNIIKDLIHSQNGTIATAIRELVMNGIDAGSESLNIIISKKYFEIQDFGRGFKDKDEIMRFFKTFGTPHQEGDAEYGRFRIGRGQIMAFAKSSWYSKNFVMTTDINSGKQGFELIEDADYIDGCKVYGEFYEDLRDYDLKNVVISLREYVKYADYDIRLNNIPINQNSNAKWTYEDDLVKVLIEPKGTHGLNLYSKGILVKQLHQYTYGFSADVVTKKTLQLNMARNEINENDEVWQHVHKILRAEMRKRRNKNLNEFERLALIDQFINCEIEFEDIFKLPLIADSRGKKFSIYNLLSKKTGWSFATDKDKKIADGLNTTRTAFVMLDRELDNWGVNNIQSFIDLFVTSIQESFSSQGQFRWFYNKFKSVRIIDFNLIKNNYNPVNTHYKNSELTKIQQLQRNTLQYLSKNMANRLSRIRGEDIRERKIIIGKSDTSIAWTDSTTYIAFNKDILKYFNSGISGLAYLSNVMLHEFTHLGGSISDHDHDFNFYEQFHDSVLVPSLKYELIGNSITSLQTKYESELEKNGMPFPKWMNKKGVSNDIILGLNSKRPNKVLKYILELYGLSSKMKNNQLILSVSHSKIYDLAKTFGKKLASRIKSNFPEYFNVLEEKTSHIVQDWKKVEKIKNEISAEYIKKLLVQDGFKENLDELTELLLGLRSCRYNDTQFGGLNDLTSYESTGVISVEREILRPTKIMAGKGFEIGIQLPADTYYYGYNTSATELAEGGKAERSAYIHDRITKIINSISDKDERQELIDSLFNEDMKKILS